MIFCSQSQPADWNVRAEIGAILFTSALALAPLSVLAVRRIFPGRTVVFARWGFSHVVQVALLAFAIFWITGLFLPGPEREAGILLQLSRSAAILLGACALVAWTAHRLDPDGLRCLGLGRGRHLRAALAGLVGYASSLPGLLGLCLLWPWFLRWSGAGFEMPLVARKMMELAPEDRPVAILLGVAVLPLLEEILFRVFLQPLLVQNLTDKLGVVVTSFVFAALHGTSAFLPIFGLSLVLGSIMLRTQRLAAVWAVHALHNGLMFAMLYLLPREVVVGLFFP